MKILIVSNYPLSINNSFGNSIFNLFKNIENVSFANIYLRNETVEYNEHVSYFRITEKQLIRNFFNKRKSAGCKVEDFGPKNDSVITKFGKKYHFQLLLWVRDFVWSFGNWRCKELTNFINEFKPDLIFQPIYFASHINKVANYVKKITGCKMIGYVTDDVYRTSILSQSLLGVFDTLIKRKEIKRIINNCSKLFVITEEQKKAYDRLFSVNSIVLTKKGDFSKIPPNHCKRNSKEPIRIVYGGNLGVGRWKTISLFCKALSKNANYNSSNIAIDIYSNTHLSHKQYLALNTAISKTHNNIPYSDFRKLLSQSTIVLHCESFSKHEKMLCKYSFSTKLVDYFELSKPIIAIGPKSLASISYLEKHNSAFVIDEKKNIYPILKNIIFDDGFIEVYSKASWNIGKEFHNDDIIDSKLSSALEEALKSESGID